MSGAGLFYWNEKHGKSQPNVLRMIYRITAAKTVLPYPAGADSFTFFDAPTQAQIDAYLTLANDFLLTTFDATAMGADAFGGIIRMSGAGPGSTGAYGQAIDVVSMEAYCASGAGLATIVQRVADPSVGLTASTLQTAVGVSAAGNIGFKVDFGNTPDFDALTAGIISVKIGWVAK